VVLVSLGGGGEDGGNPRETDSNNEWVVTRGQGNVILKTR